jgi:phosphatidylglycerol:prolipoprotein diacylglycerol transferase
MLPFLHCGPFTLASYGLMAWCGFAGAYLMLRAEARRRVSRISALAAVLVIAAAGLSGAKLYHALERPAALFVAPLEMLFGASGFAWFGGMAGGLTAIWWLARHYHVHTADLLDMCSPAAALGYAVGRLGCLLSGDGDYGAATSLPWAMSFPHGLVPTAALVHPTPIYEFLAAVALSIWLWKAGGNQLRLGSPAGTVVWQYLVWQGIMRLLVECIRLNPPAILGLTNAQAAALVSIAGGLWLKERIGRRSDALPINKCAVFGA